MDGYCSQWCSNGPDPIFDFVIYHKLPDRSIKRSADRACDGWTNEIFGIGIGIGTDGSPWCTFDTCNFDTMHVFIGFYRQQLLLMDEFYLFNPAGGVLRMPSSVRIVKLLVPWEDDVNEVVPGVLNRASWQGLFKQGEDVFCRFSNSVKQVELNIVKSCWILNHVLIHFLNPFLNPFLNHFLHPFLNHFLNPFLNHFLNHCLKVWIMLNLPLSGRVTCLLCDACCFRRLRVSASIVCESVD